MASFNLALLAVVGFALVKSGESLRCWSCSSDMDAPCADYFNTTLYRRSFYGNVNGVEMKTCEDNQMHYGYGQQRAVCMKRKMSSYGRITYQRQCQFMHRDQPVGACPDDGPQGSTTTEFCEYCDTDGCNGATSIQTTVLSAVAPLAIFLLFRK